MPAIIKHRGTDMNINTIKRFAFLALAIAVPSVVTAESIKTVSVEEARERYGIEMSIQDTPDAYNLTIRYPQHRVILFDEAVPLLGTYTINHAKSLRISFQLSSSSEIEVLVELPGVIYVPPALSRLQTRAGKILEYSHDAQNRCRQCTMRYAKLKRYRALQDEPRLIQ